jgi:hypothetical protein
VVHCTMVVSSLAGPALCLGHGHVATVVSAVDTAATDQS